MSKVNKTLIRIRFVDLMNKPFPNLYHEVMVSGDKYASSAGNSDSEGLGVWIEKPVGTQLNILVRHPLTKKLVNAKQYVIVPIKKGVFRVHAPFSIQRMKLIQLSEGGSTRRKTYKIESGDDLYSIAKKFDTTWQILFELNKDTIKKPDQIFPGRWIKVPPKGSSLTGKTNSEPDSLKNPTHYTVKKGETLSGISQRSGVSVEQLQRMNGITNPATLQAGQTIKLRSDGSAQAHTTPKTLPTPTARPKPTTSAPEKDEEGFFGGLLESIGDGLGVLGEKTKEGFESINDAMSGGKNDKPAGQAAGSSNNTSSTSGTYTVKSDDTLSGIAKRHGVNASDLARANGLKLSDSIYPEDKLDIPKGGSSTSSSLSSKSGKPNNLIEVTTKTGNSTNGTPKEIATTNGACICKAHNLIWGAKVSCDFRIKVIEICQDLWPDDYLEMANNLMAVFAWESGRTFKADAPNQGNSGGTGLIQFMPNTYQGLTGEKAIMETIINYWGRGKTLKRVKQLAEMDEVRQLDLVKKYFEPKRNKKLEFIDFYLQVLFPVSSGKHDHVVFADNITKLDRENESSKLKNLRVRAYPQNKIDPNKDGKVMKSEIAKAVNHYLTDGLKYKDFKSTCSQVVQPPAQSFSNLELNPLACGGKKHYERTLKNIAALHPVYQPYVIKLINEGYEKTGITWVITDGYRSPKAQDQLSSKVTSAGALQSYHQYGLAIDVVSVTDGEITYLSNNSLSIFNSKKLGLVGKELGLIWGGVWRRPDYPHFELHPKGKTWRDLKPKLLQLGVENYKNLTLE